MFKLKTTASFECAHRLYSVETYSDECRANVHGHSYYVTFYISRKELNDAGMIMDFKLLKKTINDKLISVYDHACILKSNDPLVESITSNCKKVIVVDENPTAEWMTQHFYNLISEELSKLDPDVIVTECDVQETDKNIAIYIPEEG